MDFLWVVGSVGLVSIPSMATDSGKAGILAVSVVVGIFAVWQLTALVGLRKQRRNAPNTGNATASFMLGGLLVSMMSGCSPADLRPASLTHDVVDQMVINRGEALLREVALAHGLAAWEQFETQEVVLTDTWQAPGWWPADQQTISFKSILGTFTARADLIDGPEAGGQLGIQAWQAYERDQAGELILLPADEEMSVQNFYIPSLQYFHELPFRMLKAENIAYVGEQEYRGTMYNLIFVTWGGFELNEEHDQYILWIDQTTSLINMCHYTVRQAGGLFTGTIHFEDYRDIQGVQFPFEQTVVLPPPPNTLYPLSKYFLHRSEFSAVSFDSFPVSELIVDETLVPADVKR